MGTRWLKLIQQSVVQTETEDELLMPYERFLIGGKESDALVVCTDVSPCLNAQMRSKQDVSRVKQLQVFEKEHKVMMKAMEAMIATHESKQEIARQAVLRLQVCSFTNHSRIAVTRAFAI